MKSNYPVVTLKGHVHQISLRNESKSDAEVYSVTNLEGFTKSTDYFSKKVFSKDISNYKVVSAGQFAYNPSRINVGSIDYLRCAERALVSPLYIVFKTVKEIYPDYLLRYLKSNWGNLQVRANTQGAVRDSLKFKGLENIKIPLPLLDDQIRIAHLLSKVEGLIAQRKQHLQQLDDLLKSVFLAMFGDPVRNEKEWDKPELKEFGAISTGNTPPRKDASNYSSRHIEWIKTDNIISDSVFITRAAEYLSQTGSKKARAVSNGALLVACIAGSVESIGRAALTNRSVTFNQQINAIQPYSDVNPFYLYALFKISRAFVQSHATKGMKKMLTKGDFEAIRMIKPPINLQNRYASIVEKVEWINVHYRQSLVELENLYGALSQKVFKGEQDLSRVPLAPEQHEKEEVIQITTIAAVSPKAIELPDPLDILSLRSVEGRAALTGQWLAAYLGQLDSGAAFSTADFLEAAQKRIDELLEDETPELGVAAYDLIKAWVFAALESGRLSQRYDDDGNRVQLFSAKD